MKNQIMIFVSTLLTLCGGSSNASAQGAFAGQDKSWWITERRLEIYDDNTFFLSADGKPHTGTWEKIDEKTIRLHFDKITDIALLLTSGKIYKEDEDVEILNENEICFDGTVLTKIEWTREPAKLTIQDSVFTFEINNRSYSGISEQKNDRVRILHMDKNSDIFYPTPDEAYRKILVIEEYNRNEEADEYIQAKLPWVTEGMDIRLEMDPDSTFTFLYRRKFYTGQWSRNTEKEIKLQFDMKPEFKTLWNMGYLDVDLNDLNTLAVFEGDSFLPLPAPIKNRLQLNKDQTFYSIFEGQLQTGRWQKKSKNLISLSFDKINKQEIKYRFDEFRYNYSPNDYLIEYFQEKDVKIINKNKVKFDSYILKRK